jgi:hypothetical protein
LPENAPSSEFYFTTIQQKHVAAWAKRDRGPQLPAAPTATGADSSQS